MSSVNSGPAGLSQIQVEPMSSGQYQARLAGIIPEIEEVISGLWSIPVPIGMPSLRYVLVYALESRSGLILIDVGIDTPEAREALTAGLRRFGSAPADVRGVLVTHRHHDHLGLAARVAEASGAWVAMHSADIEGVKRGCDATTKLLGLRERQLRRSGVPADLASSDLERVASIWCSLHVADVALEDGAMLDIPDWHLRCVWTPGHTPGHVCFADDNRQLIFVGDHLLPRISPNIVVLPGEPDDPLGDFVSSLGKVADTVSHWNCAQVLPAHDYRYRGLSTRVAQLRHHHEQRLAEIAEVLADGIPRSAYGVAMRLTWSRPAEQMPAHHLQLATSETQAHLHYLLRRDRRLTCRQGSELDTWDLHLESLVTKGGAV
jgi:glyoxylase-like metal-dependent hydrolase (beta-lactamase superfamily II)